MTRDYLIRMAHECGIHLGGPPLEPGLERFADLVAETEREACAKVCEQRGDGWLEVRNARTIDEGCMHSAAKAEAIALAAAIRARGQK